MTNILNNFCMSDEGIVASRMTKQPVFSGVFPQKNYLYLETWSGIKVADFERGSSDPTNFF
jgi:hypothetical protein